MHTKLKDGTTVYYENGRIFVATDAPEQIEPYTHGWLTGFMTGCIGTCVTLGALWVLL